jgi:hypothetical protein
MLAPLTSLVGECSQTKSSKAKGTIKVPCVGDPPSLVDVLQAIFAIKLPTGVRQLRHFLGMVQYYCDLWARWSDMLAPLTLLVGECGQTKSTKANGTKKVPWQWDEVH